MSTVRRASSAIGSSSPQPSASGIARGADGVIHVPMTLRSLRPGRALPDEPAVESAKYPGIVLDAHFWRSSLDHLPRCSATDDGAVVACRKEIEGLVDSTEAQHQFGFSSASAMLTVANLTSYAHEAQSSLFDSFSHEGKIDAKGLSGLLAAYGTPCSDRMADALIRNVVASAATTVVAIGPHQTPKLEYPELGSLLSAVSIALSKSLAAKSFFSPPSAEEKKAPGEPTPPRRKSPSLLHISPQRQRGRSPSCSTSSPAPRHRQVNSPQRLDTASSPSARVSPSVLLSSSHLPAVTAGSLHAHTLVSVRRVSPWRCSTTPTRPMSRTSPSRTPTTKTPAEHPFSSPKGNSCGDVVRRGSPGSASSSSLCARGANNADRQAFSPVISPRAQRTPSRTLSNLAAPLDHHRSATRSRLECPRPTLQGILESRSDVRRSLDSSRSPASRLEARNSIGQLGVWTPSRW